MHEAIVLASNGYGKLVADGDGGARSVMLADGGGDAKSNFRVVGLRARSLSSEPRTERKLRANRDRNLVAAGGNKRAQLQLLKSCSHNVTTAVTGPPPRHYGFNFRVIGGSGSPLGYPRASQPDRS